MGLIQRILSIGKPKKYRIAIGLYKGHICYPSGWGKYCGKWYKRMKVICPNNTYTHILITRPNIIEEIE